MSRRARKRSSASSNPGVLSSLEPSSAAASQLGAGSMLHATLRGVVEMSLASGSADRTTVERVLYELWQEAARGGGGPDREPHVRRASRRVSSRLPASITEASTGPSLTAWAGWGVPAGAPGWAEEEDPDERMSA